MNNFLYILLVLIVTLALIGSRCSPTPPLPPKPVWPEEAKPASLSKDGDDLVGLSFVSYTNKAVGYTILRPNNWYWRHYIANEIKSINPSVVDYFITDLKPLPGLGSEYLGQVVIEVSIKELSDYTETIAGLESSDSLVGGIPAKRYVGEKIDQNGKKIRTVEYQFRHNGKTFRLIYRADELSSTEKSVFEQIVSSFKF